MPVSSIRIGVDRATYIAWSRAMANLSRTFSVPVQTVGPVSALPPIPPTLSFTGVELLNDVGRACTRPDVSDDPERFFALFRYATKISRSVPNLRLASNGAIRDRHKAAVLSDEIGCGFAFLVASRLLGTSVFLDLHDAVARGLVSTSSPNSLMPDYIALPGPGGDTVVLEAKGTQSRRHCQTTQIPRGCDQVSSLNLPGGGGLRVVIGVELRKDIHPTNTTVFVGDPEERRSFSYEFAGTPASVAVRQHYMRIAALIGDWPLRREVGREREEAEAAPLATRVVGQREAVGSTFEIHSEGSITGFFVGIDLSAREELLASLAKTDEPPVVEVEPVHGGVRESGTSSFFSVARDGAVLEVWTEGKLQDEIFAGLA